MATRSSKTTMEPVKADETEAPPTGRSSVRAAAAAAAAVTDPPVEAPGDAGPGPDPATPAATVVTDTAVVAGPELKKKELIDRVVARSGLKKREVKPAVEAMLEVLGEAIQAGEELNVPPFGKLKITRSKELANARVYHCRLRQPDTGLPAAAGPLAEDDEDG